MAENGNASGSDQPQESRNRGRNEGNGDRNTGKCSVKLRRGSTECTNLKIIATKLANCPHATNNQDDVKEKPKVGEQAVDAEHDKDHGIVAGEIAEVVIDSSLYFPEVVWLRQSLQIQELGDRSDVGKSGGERLRSYTVETVGQVETGRQSVQRDADSSHCVLESDCNEERFDRSL